MELALCLPESCRPRSVGRAADAALLHAWCTNPQWAGLKGNPLAGWPDELWLDIRQAGVRSIMTRRMQFAKSIGCVASSLQRAAGWQAHQRHAVQTLLRAARLLHASWALRYLRRTERKMGCSLKGAHLLQAPPAAGSLLQLACAPWGVQR